MNTVTLHSKVTVVDVTWCLCVRRRYTVNTVTLHSKVTVVDVNMGVCVFRRRYTVPSG